MKLFLVVLFTFAAVQADYMPWDWMSLTLQYAPGLCYTSQQTCVFPDNGENYFSIHGLWPNANDGQYPSMCNSSWAFDLSQLDSIRNDLNKYWLTLFTSDTACEFWQHEWVKHGTCAAMGDSLLGSELAFFTQTLNLRSTYDPMVALTAANISPSDSFYYQPAAVRTAFRNQYGADASFACDWGQSNTKYDNKVALTGVTVCIDKSLKIMDCPASELSQDSCNYDHIYVPVNPK